MGSESVVKISIDELGPRMSELLSLERLRQNEEASGQEFGT